MLLELVNCNLILLLQTGGDATLVVCCGGPILFLIVLIVIAIQSGDEQTKELNAARDSYLNSLRQLKANPTNADLRETTLRLGRTYSN